MNLRSRHCSITLRQQELLQISEDVQRFEMRRVPARASVISGNLVLSNMARNVMYMLLRIFRILH